MKLANCVLALAMTLALASSVEAQFRYSTWPTQPPVISPPTTYYYSPPYRYQTHWIYGYMPAGYDGFAYPWGGFGGYGAFGGYGGLGVQYGYVPQLYSVPARDYGPPARSRASLYPALPYSEFAAEEHQRASDNRGYINVTLPVADAKIWINGQLMTQTGKTRTFTTPVLENTARQHSFEIRATWTDEFGPRTKNEKIQIRAGETHDVVFK